MEMPSSDNLLPDEIIVEILLRLDLKDVLRFRYVSKSWYALINDLYFMEKHIEHIESRANLSLIIRECGNWREPYKVDLNYGSVEYNAEKLDDRPSLPVFQKHFNSTVGSCNGLVCLSNSFNCVTIWNPWTRKFHKLPPMPRQCRDTEIGCRKVYGFGHDRITDDYKVIGIPKKFGSHDNAHLRIQARVYSLKKKSWAKNTCILDRRPSTDCGTFASISNAIYWIMERNELSESDLIGAFDLRVDNGYHEVQLPHYTPKNGSNNNPKTFLRTLGVLRGCLCLFSTNHLYSSDLWIMKESSWTRLISFADPSRDWDRMRIKPLAYSRSSGNKLLLHDDHIHKLIWYDLETKTASTAKLQEDLYVGQVCLHQEATRGKEESNDFSSSWCKIFQCFKLIFSCLVCS